MQFESSVTIDGKVEPSIPFKNKAVYSRIKKVDFFPKAVEQVQKQTTIGAIFSIIITALLTIFLISEIISFLRVRRYDTMDIDKLSEETIPINFDISFHKVTCMDLHVDAIDQAGSQQINVKQNIKKIPLDEKGNPLNSLKTMMNALIQNPIDSELPQGVGCRMSGTINVQKVAGNFHFAPGQSFSQELETRVHHIHQYNPILVNRWDSAHTIHSLSFGQKMENDLKYPLDNHEMKCNSLIKKEEKPENEKEQTSVCLIKYFIKIVPTSFKNQKYFGLFGNLRTYQFSVTKHIEKMKKQEINQLPGVFFLYDLSPIAITYEYKRMSLFHFLVRFLAVFGGIFVCGSMVERLIETGVKIVSFEKKHD